MKKNIVLKSLAGILVAGALGSCSGDYLDIAPEVDYPTSTVLGTTESAVYAVNGLCNSMYFPYQNPSVVPNISGEAWMGSFYGDLFSPDWFDYLFQGNGVDFMRWDFMTKADYIPAYPAWMYGYNLINQANMILQDIDNATGPEADRKFLKAHALSIRAHAYTLLLKIYGPRWEDSDNGRKYVLVYRTEPGTGDAPLASMNKVLRLIYGDLQEAIKLYEESGKSRTYDWEPDIDIARGLLARAAMLKHDWALARDMSRLARAKYPIMEPADYIAGFYTPTSEWMWCNAADEMVCGYAGWGAWFACNGAYVGAWGQSAGQISYDLYKQTDPNDIRRELYFTPDKKLPQGVSQDVFWNGEICNPESMNMNDYAMTKMAIRKMANDLLPNGDKSLFNEAYTNWAAPSQESDAIIPFGAQFKFWGMGMYSTLSSPFMRASELALYEAEACYMLSDITGAQKALTDVNSKRISGYTCTKTGNDFWEEYMISSRMELWGEGHTWFNMKRWNVPAVRNPWIEGDVNSNNMPAKFKYVNGPEVQNGWRWAMPLSESRNNKLAKSTMLDESAPVGSDD